jgi:hypothetical protein
MAAATTYVKYSPRTKILQLYDKQGSTGVSISLSYICIGVSMMAYHHVLQCRLYYTHLRVGNPPKRYFVDVDTGSDLTWIQCDAPCRSCAKVISESDLLPHKYLDFLIIYINPPLFITLSLLSCDSTHTHTLMNPYN